MAEFEVAIKKRAVSEIEALDKRVGKRILGKITSLSRNPYPVGSKKLRRSKRSYRLRVRDYRILYQVDRRAKEIIIFAIGHRKDIYRKRK